MVSRSSRSGAGLLDGFGGKIPAYPLEISRGLPRLRPAPASTCTSWQSSRSSCSATIRPTGWPAGRLAELDAGATPAPCAPPPAPSLAGSKAAELDKAPGYFEHNAHCLHYARVKSLSMFTGSGGVEAGCKAIAGQRCKLSGMRLSKDGAADIRRMEASSRWEEIWIQPGQAPAA